MEEMGWQETSSGYPGNAEEGQPPQTGAVRKASWTRATVGLSNYF